MTAVGKRVSALALAFALSAFAPLAAAGDDAKVLGVKVSAEPGGTYRFDVTVGHSDQGWKHYADKFEVMTPGGRVLGTQTLLHPTRTSSRSPASFRACACRREPPRWWCGHGTTCMGRAKKP